MKTNRQSQMQPQHLLMRAGHRAPDWLPVFSGRRRLCLSLSFGECRVGNGVVGKGVGPGEPEIVTVISHSPGLTPPVLETHGRDLVGLTLELGLLEMPASLVRWRVCELPCFLECSGL